MNEADKGKICTGGIAFTPLLRGLSRRKPCMVLRQKMRVNVWFYLFSRLLIYGLYGVLY